MLCAGETWQATLSDGSQIFLEQISHHPPVSAFELCGPNGSYVFSGLSQPVVSFGVKNQTVKTVAKGYRAVAFPDGTKISIHYPAYYLKGMLGPGEGLGRLDAAGCSQGCMAQRRLACQRGRLQGCLQVWKDFVGRAWRGWRGCSVGSARSGWITCTQCSWPRSCPIALLEQRQPCGPHSPGSKAGPLFPVRCAGLLYTSMPRAEIGGTAEFDDELNGLHASITFGKVEGSRNPVLTRSDAFSGGSTCRAPPSRAAVCAWDYAAPGSIAFKPDGC